MKTLAALLLALVASCTAPRATQYIDAAEEAGAWLASVGRDTSAGRTWPVDPAAPAGITHDLYHGTPGVVLFFLALHGATQDLDWLSEARAGADELLATLPDSLAVPEQAGLYTGVAGVGFVLGEMYRATDDPKYRAGAARCRELVTGGAHPAGAGVEWGPVTDVISGTAGIGLYLLHAAATLDDDGARDLAAAAGRRLLELGWPAVGGTSWPMSPDYPRDMPNFSHGTAGVAYFLAALFDATEELPFLDAALAGASHLVAITNADGLVYHHAPDGEDLFYLGWCHGPPGTARLYEKLFALTADEKWRTAATRAADALVASGLPHARPEGYWNTVGQCCGAAGVGEFLLGLGERTGSSEYRTVARHLGEDILARATVDEKGRRSWLQSEHRVRSELLQAQTGYMQGAAGVGLFLLRLDAERRGRVAPPAVPGAEL